MPPDTRDLTGPRWSSAVICPRWSVYGAIGAPVRERTEEEELMLRRGQAWGQIVVDGVIEGFKREGRRPRREETIAWPIADPIGTGHADCYIPHELTVVEVVSNAGGTLPAHKATQVAGYVLNHPNAEHGVVDSIDTHTGEEHVYPIVIGEFEAKVAEITEQVVAGVRTGELPDRVCKTPWDGPAQWCPHVGHCFEGWEPTPIDELLVTIDEVDLLERLADAEDAYGRASKLKDRREKKRNEIRRKVAELVEPNTPVAAAGIAKLQRTVSQKTTFSAAAARDAGHKIPPKLRPFVKTTESERWTVTRTKEDEASSIRPARRSTTPTRSTPTEGDTAS